MTRDTAVRLIEQRVAAENGWEAFEDLELAREMAELAVSALERGGMIFP
jgi:hypothetical protein